MEFMGHIFSVLPRIMCNRVFTRRRLQLFILTTLFILSAFYVTRVKCQRHRNREYFGGPDFCNLNNLRFIKQGDILKKSDCETCTCDISNDRVQCSIESCGYTYCSKLVSIPGRCCMVCAYYVPVYNMELEQFRIVRGWEYLSFHLEFDLRLEINNEGQDIRGDDMWRVDVWVSGNDDGSGKRLGERKQVLTEDQDSLSITRPKFWGGFNFTIPDVHYPLNAIDEDLCLIFELSYLCIKFAAGNDPRPEKRGIPFVVEGVHGEFNLTEDASHLIQCVPYLLCGAEEDYADIWITPKPTPPSGCPPPILPNMENLQPFADWYKYGQIVSVQCKEGHNLVGTKVLVCTNKNTWHRKYPECVREKVETTPVEPSTILTTTPTKVTEEETLPPPTTSKPKADVPVHLRKIEVVKTDDVLHIRVDVTVRSGLDGSTPLEVGTWASANADGSGKKTGFRKQVVKLIPPGIPSSRPPVEFDEFPPSQQSTITPPNTDEIPHSTIPSSQTLNHDGSQPATNLSTTTTDLFKQSNISTTTLESNKLQPLETASTPPDYDGPYTSKKNTMQSYQPSTTTAKQPPEVVEYEVSIPHVSFELDTSNTSCDDIKYLCAGISVGDVHHVHNRTSSLELVGCKRFTECEDIPVNNVEILGVESVKAGANNSINVTLEIYVNGHGRTATSNAFWRVSVWSSALANGGRERIGFLKQVLNVQQASKNYTRPHAGGYKFQIPDVTFTLNTLDASCEKLKYLCASFGISDMLGNSNESNVIPFMVYGAEAENNSAPNPDRLIGCSQFTTCTETAPALTTAQPAAIPSVRGCYPPFNVRSGIFILDPDKDFYDLYQKVNIQCANGMLLVGHDSLLCFENGIWIGKTPKCHQEPEAEEPQGCHPPSVANNSYITPRTDLYPYGQNVTIYCSDGFQLVGNNTLTCTGNGSWFGNIPYCAPQGCPRPTIGNKSVIDPDQGWYSYGETVYIQISCQKGMQPSSDYKNFVCTNNGTWYREIPHCTNQTKTSSQSKSAHVFRKAGCLRPTIPNEGGILPEQQLYHCGQQVKVTCKAEFHIVGDNIIICSNSGVWYFDIPQCVPDSKIQKQGKPSSTPFIAAQKECRRPAVSAGSILVQDKHVYTAGEHVNIFCRQGYQLVGEKHVVCSKTGNWKGKIGRCNLISKGCKRPRLPIGGRISPYQRWYSPGQTVHINCSENYHLVGEKELVCSDTGAWHRELPKCEMKEYIITPLIITLSAVGVFLLGILIVLNFISEDYKPSTPTPKLIHRVRRKNALKLMIKNNHILRTPSVGHADKCNGIAPAPTPPLARWDKI